MENYSRHDDWPKIKAEVVGAEEFTNQGSLRKILYPKAGRTVTIKPFQFPGIKVIVK